MSKINFRIYGDQIYGLSNKYLSEYINPEINKEEFLTSFKNGSLNLKITGIKKSINIMPQVSIKDMNTEKIDISIPDENSNLIIKLSKFRIMLIVKELTDEQILELLVQKRQKLIKKFIKETIKNIEKKEKSTFLENLIDTLLKSALIGLQLEFTDIEIYIKCENFLFLLKIEKIIYNENSGIKFNNINFIFNDKQNTNNKCELIKNLDVDINIKEGKDEKFNELNINIVNINLGMNVNAYKGIIHIVQIFKDNNYELILNRYKQLIDYTKPKKINDKKNYYKSLWFWAIKTIIKLKKYKSDKKLYIFDLITSSQKKYAKKYLAELNKDFDLNENFKNFECIVLPEEINLLKETKDLVEKQLLENKKGNQLANAFNFFFGGNDDNKNELSEEEKQNLNEIYTDEGIINFLRNKKDIKEIENNQNEEQKTLDKIKNFFNKISFNFAINNTEILLNSFNLKHSIYIKDIKGIVDMNIYNKIINYKLSLSDLGFDFKNSFLNHKNDEKNESIKFTKNNDIYEISFGFKSFELNEKIVLYLINFYYSLFYIETLNTNRNKFFIKSKNKNKTKINENKFNIIDKIKILNIPDITFINENKNSVSININNFIINQASISFIINIKDNNSNIILDNLGINLVKNKENTKFELELNNKINIVIPSQITKSIFSFYWQIKKLKQYYQIIEFIENNTKLNNENKIILYSFHYKIYKTLDVQQSFLDKLNIKLAIKSLSISIQENSLNTNIVIANMTFNYNNNRNILFKLGTFQITTYKSCILFISLLKLKSPDITKYLNSIDNKIKNEYNLNLNDDVLNQNIIILKDSVTNDFIYQKYIGKIINQLINICKIYITELKINYKSDDNIFMINLNRTFGEKNKNLFNFTTESSSLNYINAKNMKNVNNLMEIKEKMNFDINFMDKKMTIKAKSPRFTMNGDIVKYIKESFNYKIDKNRLRGLLKKNEVIASISNTIILFNKFIFNIANIDIQNNAKFITNSVFVTISKFIMRRSDNKNGHNLLKENEFKLSYEHKSKNNKLIEVLSTDINIILSQEDLYYLILYIANIYYNSKPTNKDKSNKKVVSNINKANNTELNFKLPRVNLNLCSNNNYRKVGELSLINTNFKINSYYEKNNNNITLEFIKETDYSVLINKILLKYNDMNNNEIVLLKSGIDKDNQAINHIEFYCTKNEAITININKNYIILRGDSFYALYHYFKNAIPLDEIKNKAKLGNNKLSKIIYLQINFDYTKFLIPSTFNANENLCFQIEKFIVIYNSINGSKFPIGTFGIKISSISGIFSSENNSRKLFNTKNEFLCVRINYIDKKLNLKVVLDTLIINLSYTDIATFLRVYYLNKILIEKEKKLIEPNKSFNNKNSTQNNHISNNQEVLRISSYNFFPDIIEKSVLFSGDFHFENFNITLIDNSSESYYPFAKLELNKINLECKQDNTINSYFSLLLLSYNYISCVWEPTIEKVFIRFSYDEKNQLKRKNFQIAIDKMNINISDMSISFTLTTLNNWIKKLIEEQKNLKNNEQSSTLGNNNIIDFKSSMILSNNELKVTNNKLINNIGIKIYIKYANKKYICEPFEQIELDYINEWDVNKYGPKQILLSLDSKMSYTIPIEKICTRLHRINNVSYIVSENILSKERQININVYSPIIFKNKSLYQLQINIFNKKGNAQYFLQKNSILGLPLFYYEPNTYLNFSLIDSYKNSTSINFSIDEIVNTKGEQIYKKNIIIGNTILLLNLDYKIPNVKTILIGCEYIFINCLPCNIGLTAKGNNYIIEKCSQQYIDFYTGNDSDIGIQITANNTTFFSRPKRLFQKVPKENGNFLKFKNANNNESFRLSLLIKNKENKKIIIIYAESLLDNKSGIDFYINSKNICFSLTENLYLISSKVNIKESSFTLNNDYYNYYSKSIFFKDIIHSSPSYFLDLKSGSNKSAYSPPKNQIQLIIDNTMSNINLKDSEISKYNIITMIYRIHSLYRITNLLSTKKFVIASQENPGEYTVIEPMSQTHFNFFHKGQGTPLIFSVNNSSYNNLNNNSEYNYGKFTTSFRFLQIGTYSFTVGDSMFNLEIRKSSSKGIIDVFITETNFNNAKIIIDNLTNNKFNVYQRNYQSFNQSIEPNKKEVLNIYDQNFLKFILQYDNNQSLDFEFIPSEIQEKQIDLGNNIVLWLESNGIKMKLSFFYKHILEQNQNFSINKNYIFSVKINEILGSIIGDNEPKSKNLRNYQRKEILLLDINDLYLEIRLDENQGILGKDVLKTYFTFNNMCLYNQSQENLKFINAFNNENNPCISLRNEIYHFKNDNVWKIKGFALNMANLRVNIDPVFVEELMDFINNIIYRMKIKNYNVDKLFLVTEEANSYNKSINLNIYQDKIKEYIKSYNEKGLVFHGTNFELPQLQLVFQISKLGLEHLLLNKFGFSSFFIWTAKGLTEKKHSINLEPYTIPLYIGDFKGIIKKIIQRYKSAVISEFVTIGIKGVIGNISKAINKKVGKKVLKFLNNALNKNQGMNFYDSDEEDNNNLLIEQNERKRIQRAFYGKFKYYKEFNQDHAYYFDTIPKRLSYLSMNFVFIDLLKGNNNNLYVFTNVSLMLMTTNLEVYNIIYYFYVAEVKWNKNMVYIRYNQNIDGNSYFQFKEQNETLASIVAKKLDDFSKNKDDLNDV